MQSWYSIFASNYEGKISKMIDIKTMPRINTQLTHAALA